MEIIKKYPVYYGVIFFVMIFFFTGVAFAVKNSFFTAPKKSRGCEEVSGNKHIYRGQCLPEGFTPQVLPLSRRASWLTTSQYLDLRAKVMVEQLIKDAEDDGYCLVVSSGYRTYEEQKKMYDDTPEGQRNIVAIAGQSEHQTGLAVDFVACPMTEGVRDDSAARLELKNEFDTLPEYKWLVAHGVDYGFEQSFTVDNIGETQYKVEPWHWKLVL